MSKRFKEARKAKKMKVIEAAKMLEVSQPTLSAWEREHKFPNINNLERMADLYDVTTDFLLGRSNNIQIQPTCPIPHEILSILHEKPVWSPIHGWLLVNFINKSLLRFDGLGMPFSNIGDLYIVQPNFAESATPESIPLAREEIKSFKEVWLEPISSDSALRNELRGYYHLNGDLAENECGNRFFLNTYGSKWLAFKIEN